MAYDFLGTFNKSQFDRFASFARAQVATIGLRIRHLTYEQGRIGSLSFTFDQGGKPLSFTASDPKSTYVGKLVAAYEVLGGQVKYDLQVRTLRQAVHLLPGTETSAPQLMSNGEVMAPKGLGDGQSAVLIQKAREWLYGPLAYRREYLEHKIRRAIDYAEQLQTEINLLKRIGESDETTDSLEYLFKTVGELFTDTQYRAIYDDKSKDEHGRLAYAPFLPYSTVGADPANIPEDASGYGRDLDGARVPGEVG
jgi:hypothetical protein